ncbi:MAG TPA: alpha/beta hydrolase [Pyrinomonadaceae bacterium]|jgi:pimeloyl-ACP methyl ester carboxylesterase|nr:alpha/beta hydrolase [Pyrinomonadaceae bacterium]
MPPRRRTGQKLLKALLPILLVLVLALAGLAAWLVYGASHPPQRAYLVTPEKFGQLSDRGLKATEETWSNRDGTSARGWLLRGTEGAPAVMLLHRYGADRSWLLNLGVKLNETTNMTVLLPDLRGHGENSPIATSTFGARETEDALAAVDYLRSLKTAQNRPLAGGPIGLYGVEMGAYAALGAAHDNQVVQSLVLDSAPDTPDDVLRAAVRGNTGFDNDLLQLLARGAARLYFFGGYRSTSGCLTAESMKDQHVLLLAGEGSGPLRASTETLSKCFPNPANVESQTGLPLTGFTLAAASPEQGETYDRRVIEFFQRTLSAKR